jgi:hypothetical protein
MLWEWEDPLMSRRDARATRLKHYIEKWGLLFEQFGTTRMAGRVVGWLLVSDPPHQTARQIASATGASAASVSTATRMLTQAAMIERIGVPGQRSVSFRITPGMWARLMRIRLGRMAVMAELAEEGLQILKPVRGDRAARLQEIRSYIAFMDREMPALLERWERELQRERRSPRSSGAGGAQT